MKIFYFIILSSIFFATCSPYKYLAEDETLLAENNIKFVDGENIDNKSDFRLELDTYIKQKPNTNYLWFFPRETFYYKNKFKTAAEVPSIYDEQLAIASAETLKKYLRNVKGYYDAEVSYEADSYNKETAVDYIITTGKRYTIRSIEYIGEDTGVINEIKSIKAESIIQPGLPLDADLFNSEKSRLVSYLQNIGYANFNPSYLEVKGDSSNNDNTVDVFINIKKPTNIEKFVKYSIGEINVYTDFHQDQDTSLLSNTILFDKNFRKEQSEYVIKPKAINKVVFVQPGDLYNRDDRYKTLRKLSDLGTYKFANVSPFILPGKDSLINYNILLTPHEKKYVTDLGSNLFYSTINTLSRKLFGFSVGGALQDRNFFGGAESNRLSAEIGFEFEILNNSLSTNTLSISLQDNLEIPRFVDWIGSVKLLKNTGLLRPKWYQDIKDDTKTNIGIGYSFQQILNQYNISVINASYGFTYQPNKDEKLDLIQIGLNWFNYDLKPDFINNVIQDNPLLQRSFENAFISGFLFQELSYFKKSVISPRSTWAFIGSFEISGLETYIANSLFNVATGSDDTWKISDDLQFANYVRLQLDWRNYRKVTQQSVFASRFYFGIAVPYADDIVNPYIKQLYVGGPNSIRAWQSRELGPGSYSEKLLNPVRGQAFYQTGDLKLEFNFEYRFDMFWLFEGAFFLDGGNVWTLRSDVDRVGSKISSNFIDDIALGIGWGLRWDLTYFVIRSDFGYPLRYPFDDLGKQWNFDYVGFGNVNIAVNYPF
jgi:outer membrane protein assembly factor BamA